MTPITTKLLLQSTDRRVIQERAPLILRIAELDRVADCAEVAPALDELLRLPARGPLCEPHCIVNRHKQPAYQTSFTARAVGTMWRGSAARGKSFAAVLAEVFNTRAKRLRRFSRRAASARDHSDPAAANRGTGVEVQLQNPVRGGPLHCACQIMTSRTGVECSWPMVAHR